MNQIARTAIYVVIGALAVAVAYATYPKPVEIQPAAAENELLFASYTDPEAVASLEIKKFDADRTTFDRFAVEKKGDRWAIPSHEDYPADAKDQLVKAATALSDLTITTVVTDEAGDAERQRYGVFEPKDENLARGSEALGTQVVMRDASGKELLNLVVGKEVPEKPELRYVSIPGQDRIMTVKLSTEPLTTKFHEWIETDLLKIGSVWDISKLALHDYTMFEAGGGFAVEERSKIAFDRDLKDNAWKLANIEQFNRQQRKWIAAPPGPDEELDQTKVDAMRDALNQLKIVNVQKKPEGFKRTFLTGEATEAEQTQAFVSLINKGFYLVPSEEEEGQTTVEMKSSDGELVVSMNDGVEYVLRFGKAAGLGKAEPEKEAVGDKKADGEKKEEEKVAEPTLERYLFVMARFNQDLIAKPELEKLPEATATEEAPPESAAPTAPGPAESSPSGVEEAAPKTESPQNDTPNNDTPNTQVPNEDAPKNDAPKSDTGGDKLALQTVSYLQEEGSEKKEDAAAASDSPPKAEVPQPDAAAPQTDEAKPEEAKPADAKPADAKPAEDAAAKLEAERKRVEAENKRKQGEYDQKVADGKKKVADLNERFADWYYVIPEDVYRKIHLDRAAVIKKKEKPAAEGADHPGLPEVPFKVPGAE